MAGNSTTNNVNVTPEFVRAGNAIFTASCLATGKHFTYKVYRGGGKWQDSYFAKCLTGPDNVTDYRYLGVVQLFPVKPPEVRITGRSNWKDRDALPVKVLEWALKVVWQVAGGKYRLPGTHAIQHIGQCGRCGRALTTPESLATGLGPECAAQLGVAWSTTPRMELVHG